MLKAADITVQSTQLLHLAEETSDLAQDGGLSKDTTDNVWDAKFNKIKNLLDPTDPGDAVTLNYITKNQDSLLTQLRNTGAAQNSSIVSTGDSQNARLNATGDNQNTRLNTTGDTQDKRLNDLGQKYVDLMTTLKDTATTKANEATNSAALSKKWAMASSSPDGVSGNKSSKTWAEEAKTSASNSAASASASQTSATASATSATNSANSASASKQSATASASSAAASANSASAASTSASNAKTSETNAANSAKAAKQSEENAKTWDPTNYLTKEYIQNDRFAVITIAKSNNGGHWCIIPLEKIEKYPDARKAYGGTFIYQYPPVVGINDSKQRLFSMMTISSPYDSDDCNNDRLKSTDSSIYPVEFRYKDTGEVWWGIKLNHGYTGYCSLIGTFTNVSAIKAQEEIFCDKNGTPPDNIEILASAIIYDYQTKKQVIDWVTGNFTASAVTDALAQTLSDTTANLKALTTKVDSHFNDSGHLVLGESELWIK